MMGSIRAELLMLRKRVSTWVLLGLWSVAAGLFAYVLPYSTYRGGTESFGPPPPDLASLLPDRFAGTALGGYPFFGGMMVLILGVMTMGGEYGWGTLKTILSQHPSRMRLLGAKLVALGLILWVFVLASFLISVVASASVASLEDVDSSWPNIWTIGEAMLGAWLIVAVWTVLGVTLAIVSRGTSLAIGIGLLYGLVLEGLAEALLRQVDALEPLVQGLLRANAYSLAAALGMGEADASGNGPGSFSGPFVGGLQSTLVLLGLTVAFTAISAALLTRRDVT